MTTRRDFFKQLAAGGAAVTQRPAHRNRRAHHQDIVLYRGPVQIPDDVRAAVAADPRLAKTSHRHYVARYAADGITYRFRAAIPEHGGCVGEVVRTVDGRYRVHCWSAADPGDYRRVADIIAQDSI